MMTTELTLDDLLADFELVCKHIPTTYKADPSLAYEVTIKRKGRDLVTTPYRMGIGHIPGWKHKFNITLHDEKSINCALSSGMGALYMKNNCFEYTGGPKIEPTLKDVMYCLLSDSDALDYRNFEDWADNLGYDPDSRKAEATYRACLDTGLKLKNGIGDDLFRDLRNAYQGY